MHGIAWRAGALVGGLLSAGVLIAGPTTTAELLRLALLVGVTASVVGAALVRKPGRPGPWWVLAAGVGAFAVASVLGLFPFGATGLGGVVVDVVVLAGYLLLAGAANWITRTVAEPDERGALLDGAIVGIAAASVAAVLLFQPGLLEQSGPSRVHLFVGPVMFAAIAGIVARFALLMPRACVSAWLLVAATTAGLGGNLLRTAAEAEGIGFSTGSLADALMLLGYVALGVGALHPSAVMLTDAMVRPTGPRTKMRIVLLGVAMVVSPLMLVLEPPQPGRQLAAVAAALVNVLVLGRMARLFVEWERAADALRDESRRDPLTGLYNRTHLEEQLDVALRRTRRGGSLALLFCDIDDFKSVNDGFGHRVGDLVLMEVADRLQAAIRANDALVRLAGDEFVILAEGAGESEARQLTDRVRDAVGHPILVEGRSIAVSVSIGMKVSDRPCTPEDLFEGADLAMYAHKRAHATPSPNPDTAATLASTPQDDRHLDMRI